MKPLIVYFTFSKNNEKFAKHLASDAGIDCVKITEPRKRGVFRILMDMLFSRFPTIDPVDIDWKNYDELVLIAPIWNLHIAHPMKTFIRNEKSHFANFSFASLCTGRETQKKSVKNQLLRLAQKTPKHIELFQIRQLPQYDESMSTNYRVTELDLKYFCQTKEYKDLIVHLTHQTKQHEY